MAIFSSKRKKDSNQQNGAQANGPAGSASPPPSNASGQFTRSVSASGMAGGVSSGNGSAGMMGGSSGGSGGSQGGQLQGGQQGHSPPARYGDPSTSAPGTPPAAGSNTILYPWAQRRLHLLPSSLLPAPSNHPASPPAPVWGAPSSPPFPRYGHSVNPIASTPSGDLYIFGGLVANAVRNDLYVLGCTPGGAGGGGSGNAGPTGMLSVGVVETRGEVPGPRVGHASVGVGNVLIVWGGDTKSRPEDKQDDGLYLLNLSTREWTRVKTIGPNPEGRYGHAAAMVGSRFFVFGGQKDDGGFMNDLVWFDLQKLKAGQPNWSFVDYAPNAVVPPKRTGHTTVTHGDCIYVFGGTDGQYHYNDTWCYDTTTQLWAEMSCIGYIPVPREGHAATLVDDVMYVFGGRGVDGKDLEDLAAFKITNQRWFMFQNMGPAPSGRSGHAMATWQNKVYVLGGESYTSQRVDDPSFVHVLDTSKIKYPVDNSRQQQGIARKPSLPVIMSNVPPTALMNTSPPLAGAEDNLRRAPSPPTVRNGSGSFPTNGQQSFGQVIGQGPAPTTSMNSVGNSASEAAAAAVLPKSTKRSPSGQGSPNPLRPPRPDESPLDSETSPGRFEDRAPSPTVSMQPQQLSRAVSPNLVTSPADSITGRSKGDSPASASVASLVGGAAAIAGVSRMGGTPRSGSPLQQRSGSIDPVEPTSSNGVVPQDAFYYNTSKGASPIVDSSESLRAKDEEIKSLKAREVWMRTALAQATRRGYVSGDTEGASSLEGLKVEGTEGNQQIVEALMAMKQELARAKMELSNQAHSVDERVAGASRARTNAIQEASYYRAKLAALESGSTGDAAKLDRERSLELEKKLADSLASKAALEKQVEELQSHVQHHSELRESAEERHAEAIGRADESEGSYAKHLTAFAALQAQSQGHESTIQDHVERSVALTSTNQQLLAENTHLKSAVETSQSSVAQHLSVLEQTQLALAAADARNAETHAVWTESQEELASHQTRAQELQVELNSSRVQHEAAIAKASNLERVLKATQDEHDATKVLAAGGLAELIAAHRENASRDVPSPELHAEQLKAVETEAESMKQLHQEARAKGDSAIAELGEVRAREVALQIQVLQLRSEVATLRGHHAKALGDAEVLKSAVVGREAEVRDASRAREAAEVKSNLLRNLMADHGLSVSDDELATRFPPMDGTETAETLHRRVQDLEGRLAQQTRTHQELETNHDDAVRELKDKDERYQESHRQRQVSEEQVGHLTGEVERLRTTATPEASANAERATKAEESLEALQGRHRHLEETHMKAVQYVKGTEKMLRRMKEELTRYKERNEELETQVASSTKDRSAHEDLKAEVGGLYTQMSTLHATSSKHSSDNEELQRRISTLTNDFRLQQGQAAKSIKDLQSAVSKAHHDLEETLAVNHALNEELTSALKNPTSPRSTSKGGGADAADIRLLEQELTQAQNKAEWLKRENDQLEQRCLVAEQKIGILLDHMESADGEAYEGSSNSHHPAHSQHAGNFESQPAHNWKHESGVSDGGSEYSERR